MRIINSGEIFDIYGDSLQTYEQLPAQAYVVRLNDQRGYFLEKYSDIEINEKVYGVHLDKVDKVLNTFSKFRRNLGVILSGDKGIGKSLFAKLLSIEAVKGGLPLIIVDRYYPGIASYIESIEQEVMVLFDEFDKTFGDVKASEGNTSPQAELLTLFDGVGTGKKLYAITCNDLNKLNDFLVNRPGRFHYHFRFGYPNPAEVEEYMKDNIPEEMYEEIPKVVGFSQRINLNYDCLRAIAFEISSGLSFNEAIEDLNIINTNEYQSYNVALHYANGEILIAKNTRIDMFQEDELETEITLYDKAGSSIGYVRFDVSDCAFSETTGCYVITPEYLTMEYYDYYDKDDEEYKTIQRLKSTKIDCVTIKRRPTKNIHYAV